jgi:regulation of enolase protein 1 (concanavalin A-like superfamily)
MQWHNQPPSWTMQDGTLRVTAGPKTDFWRKTHYGFIRDNGHFYFQEVDGDFIAEVKVSGDYAALYDQAGLMLRVDETIWLKCGIEFVDGVQQASAVVTRDFSDWSVVPLAGNPPSLWLRVRRKAEAVEVFYSLNGERYELLRMAYLTLAKTLLVGPMCAAPEGNGFPVLFEGFAIRLLSE